jgi:hypothetical protein
MMRSSSRRSLDRETVCVCVVAPGQELHHDAVVDVAESSGSHIEVNGSCTPSHQAKSQRDGPALRSVIARKRATICGRRLSEYSDTSIGALVELVGWGS